MASVLSEIPLAKQMRPEAEFQFRHLTQIHAGLVTDGEG